MSMNVERTWVELRHPETKKLMGKYCAQTQQIEVVDRGKRAVIELPKAVDVKN